MESKKTSSNNLTIIFFISYGFYTLQLLSQRLFNLYSKQALFPICLMYIMMPLFSYIIAKIINNNSFKNNKLFQIFSSLYLLITLILSLIYISNLIYIYYYPETLLIIILLFLILPIIYILLKGDHIFYYLASILLIITFIFKYVYTKNMPSIDLFTFYNFFYIDKDNILPIIILSIPLLLEPILLINNQNEINNINIKLVLTLSILLSLVGLSTNLRLIFEFGTLISKIRFPYLESIKNIVAGEFFENIDYYYLLSIVFSTYAKTGYSIITIKRSFNLNKIHAIILLLIVISLAYLGQNSMQIYNKILIPLLIICSLCLIFNLLLVIFNLLKRRITKNA